MRIKYSQKLILYIYFSLNSRVVYRTIFVGFQSPERLFRRMTGVGGRPEVVIEIANAKGEWQEVEFLYKKRPKPKISI